MKNYILIVFLILAPHVGMTFTGTAWAVSRDPAGKVLEINGKAEEVKIIRNGKIEPANPNEVLYTFDITKTGNLSTSKLGLNTKDEKQAMVYVFENSEFRLNPEILTEGNKKSKIIEFSQGILSIFAKNLKKDEDIRIKTPTAIIGIRGSFICLSVQGCSIEQKKKKMLLGQDCKPETTILQSSGDIVVLPPDMLTAPLDSPQAITVPDGTMAVVTQASQPSTQVSSTTPTTRLQTSTQAQSVSQTTSQTQTTPPATTVTLAPQTRTPTAAASSVAPSASSAVPSAVIDEKKITVQEKLKLLDEIIKMVMASRIQDPRINQIKTQLGNRTALPTSNVQMTSTQKSIQDLLAKIKAAAQKAMAQIKAKTLAAIAKAKAERLRAETKIKAQTQASISKIKAETKKTIASVQKSPIQQQKEIAKIKIETRKTIAVVKKNTQKVIVTLKKEKTAISETRKKEQKLIAEVQEKEKILIAQVQSRAPKTETIIYKAQEKEKALIAQIQAQEQKLLAEAAVQEQALIAKAKEEENILLAEMASLEQIILAQATTLLAQTRMPAAQGYSNAPALQMSLVSIAPLSPTAISVMLDAIPMASFEPGQSLTTQSVLGTKTVDTSATAQATLSASSSTASVMLDSSTGASSPSTQSLSSPGACP